MLRDVTLKTCRRRWMIGRRGERGSGISVLAARHDEPCPNLAWDFASLSLEISMPLFFFYSSFLVIVVLLILLLFVLFLVGEIIISSCWYITTGDYCLSFFISAYIVCLCHLWDVKPYASLLVFLFSGLFVEVLPSSPLRVVASILQGVKLRWDFCYIVWFRVRLSFSFFYFFCLC